MEKSGQPDTYNDDKNQQTNIDAPSQPHQGAPQQRPKTFKEKMSETFRMPQKKVPTEPFPPKFVNVDGNSLFFGEDPMNLKCPKCNQQTTTSTETTPGLLAFILGGCLAGSGFGTLGITCLCCFLPCVMTGFQDIEHACTLPNCRQKIGKYRKQF